MPEEDTQVDEISSEETQSQESEVSDEATEAEKKEESQPEEKDEFLIKDDEEEEEGTNLVNHLRKLVRTSSKENKRLKAELEKLNVAPETSILSKKPELYDYDTPEEYEKATGEWYEKKARNEAIENQKKSQQEKERAKYSEKLHAYNKEKQSLTYDGFEEAEQFVVDTFNTEQQNIMLYYFDSPAKLVATLGRNQSKAMALSDIKDPIHFAFALKELDQKRENMAKRRPPPKPEAQVSGSASKSSVVDATLQKLREEAERTGDSTKLIRYKRERRQASR